MNNFLRTLCLLLLLSAMNKIVLMAQVNNEGKKMPFTIYLGPMLNAKAGVASDVPNGTKTGVAFGGIGYGGSLQVPLTERGSAKLGLNISWETTAFKREDSTGTFILRNRYNSVFTHLNFGGFILGFAVNSPVSASLFDATPDTLISSITANDMRPNLELRLGGQFAIIDFSGGSIDFSALAGYVVKLDRYNFSPVTLALGLNYYFKLEKKN